MGLQEFLMNEYKDEKITTEVMISPFPFPFVVRSLTQAENKEIEKSCTKVSFDKKTRQKQVETDKNLYATRLLIASCVDPNFKDADLQAKFGVIGAENLVERLLKPGQYADLMIAVEEINGFEDEDINELVEEAKN